MVSRHRICNGDRNIQINWLLFWIEILSEQWRWNSRRFHPNMTRRAWTHQWCLIAVIVASTQKWRVACARKCIPSLVMTFLEWAKVSTPRENKLSHADCKLARSHRFATESLDRIKRPVSHFRYVGSASTLFVVINSIKNVKIVLTNVDESSSHRPDGWKVNRCLYFSGLLHKIRLFIQRFNQLSAIWCAPCWIYDRFQWMIMPNSIIILESCLVSIDIMSDTMIQIWNRKSEIFKRKLMLARECRGPSFTSHLLEGIGRINDFMNIN